MKRSLCILLCSCVGLALAENYNQCPNEQENCDPVSCKLPDCACSGSVPDIPLNQRPQIVYLTFDDAMTKVFDDEYYSELFLNDNYLNPNNCSIRSTFFVTARSNDYQQTHKYWRYGNEIASHSITHRSNTTYWRLLNPKGWEDEMEGMRTMLTTFANVPKDEIRGVRAPYLQGGGDEMFDMLRDSGFSYDCSAPSQRFGYTTMSYGRWPYTNEKKNDMDCQVEPCPHCSYPKIWSQPMLDFEDNRNDQNPAGDIGFPCAMLDTCIIPDSTDPMAVYDLLMKNFQRGYTGTTRAPLGLYMHTAWFVGNNWRFEGYKMFLEEILNLPDVWIVPVWAGIEYFKNPMTNDDLTNGKFEPFNCASYPKPENCFPNSCPYKVDNEDIPNQEQIVSICGFTCPDEFPWLGNPTGA